MKKGGGIREARIDMVRERVRGRCSRFEYSNGPGVLFIRSTSPFYFPQPFFFLTRAMPIQTMALTSLETICVCLLSGVFLARA